MSASHFPKQGLHSFLPGFPSLLQVHLLSQTEGVGKVRVLLMTGEEKDSSSFYDSGNQAVTGVLIAAEGADNSVVSRNIVEGVMALFQLDAHKIKVMKMK